MSDTGIHNATNEPFVSVLTPVYNGETYLEECITSVLTQTYENWEFVIVNNCSTDRSLEIAEKYAAEDDRIRIHTNDEFLGLMQNLNHAFRQISPKSTYCKVLHSDDWLFPECLKRMVAVGMEYPDVGIVSSYCLEGVKISLDGLEYPSNHISGKEICRLLLMNNFYAFSSPSSMLMRSDLIRKRDKMYDESHLHGDLSACFALLKESNFGFVHQVLTYVRRHDESVTSTIIDYETYMLGRFKMLLKHGPDFLNEAEMQHQIDKMIKKYYQFLARKVYDLKPKDFWKFHFSEMEALGFPIRYKKLAAYTLAKLSNPQMTLGRLKQSLKKRFG